MIESFTWDMISTSDHLSLLFLLNSTEAQTVLREGSVIFKASDPTKKSFSLPLSWRNTSPAWSTSMNNHNNVTQILPATFWPVIAPKRRCLQEQLGSRHNFLTYVPGGYSCSFSNKYFAAGLLPFCRQHVLSTGYLFTYEKPNPFHFWMTIFTRITCFQQSRAWSPEESKQRKTCFYFFFWKKHIKDLLLYRACLLMICWFLETKTTCNSLKFL